MLSDPIPAIIGSASKRVSLMQCPMTKAASEGIPFPAHSYPEGFPRVSAPAEYPALTVEYPVAASWDRLPWLSPLSNKCPQSAMVPPKKS
jgi:hypothetical protein